MGTRLLFVVLACAIGPAAAASQAAAHGGEAAVEILPSHANPGDAVFLYAENLDPGVTVTVALLAPEGERGLGTFASDDEGHLAAEVALPADLEARTYEVRLTTDIGTVVTSLIIVGAAEAANGGATPLLVAVVAISIGATLVAGVFITRRRRGIGGR